MMRWQKLAEEILTIEKQKQVLVNEWATLKDQCQHINLPVRELGEQHVYVCPDCGFVSYCYAI